MTDLIVIDGGRSDEERSPSASTIGTKPWCSKVRRRAKELIVELDNGYMEMARILYQVYDTPVDGDPNRGPVFKAWGFSTFGEYAEQELGIHAKKAERLRLIWYVLEIQLAGLDAGLKERVVQLGYSKVREIIRVLTLRNAKSWIELAERQTYKQLYTAIVDEKRRQGVEEALLGDNGEGESREVVLGEDGEPIERAPAPVIEKITQERFDLFPTQLEVVHQALKKAGAISGSDKKGHLLDLICTDYIATNDTNASSGDNRLRYVAKLERALGLRLIAVDPQSGDIIYGVEALEMAAQA